MTNLFLDYLKFTVKFSESELCESKYPADDDLATYLFLDRFPELLPVFAENHYFERSRGAAYYDRTLVFTDSVLISFNKPDSVYFQRMGVHVDIPSHGLEWFCNLIMGRSDYTLLELFKELKNRNCSISRVDITFDDFTRQYSPSWYYACYDPMINNGLGMKTHFHNGRVWPTVENTYIRNETKVPASAIISNHTEYPGCTFTLGKRSNGKMLRIYDKLEQMRKKLPDGSDLSDYNCIRYEFELRKEFAEDFVNQCIEEDKIPTFAEYFRFFCEIIIIDDSNISRCSIHEEWLQFLYSSQKDNFNEVFIPKYKDSVKKELKNAWFIRCCLKAAKYFAFCFGDDELLRRIHDPVLGFPKDVQIDTLFTNQEQYLV